MKKVVKIFFSLKNTYYICSTNKEQQLTNKHLY